MAVIYNLYVEPEYRKQGKATYLIKLAIEEIKLTGYDGKIGVSVEPKEKSISEKDLKAFYEKMGLVILDNV